VFHIKTPTRNSHALVQRTGEVLTSAGLPVLIVPGNHDLSNDRLDSLK
jgi:DNA repair exonuclease SbcCD nuclease subunit